jgi:hypothetical protein
LLGFLTVRTELIVQTYLFITYIVTSKPKRISVAAGVVHIIFSNLLMLAQDEISCSLE